MLCMCSMALAGTPPLPMRGIELRGIHPLSRPLVAFDAIENVIYCVGTFTDSMRVGSLRLYGSGMHDVFLAAFDPDLRPRWIQRMGGYGDDSVTCMTALPNGGVALGLMCGGQVLDVPAYTIGTTTFTGKGGYDAVVTSVDGTGAIRWTRADGAQYSEFPTAITAIANDVYVCGTFVGTSRFGSTVVQDDGRTSAYLQRISPAGESMWVQWTRGIQGSSQGRGRAEGGMACSVADGAVRAVVQVSSAISWGNSTVESTSFTYETKAAVLTASVDGTAADVTMLSPCRGDSCPSVTTTTSTSSLTSESLNCNIGNEVGFGFHRSTNSGSDIVQRFPVGGARSVASVATDGAGDNVLAGGRFERAFSFTTTQLRPDIFTQNFSLQDGFLISIRPDGSGDWALALGATNWSTITSCAMRSATIAVAATVVGQVPVGAGNVGASLTDTLGALIMFESIISDVTETPGLDEANIPANMILPVLDVLGRHVAVYCNAAFTPSSLPTGLYGVLMANGTIRTLHIDDHGAVRIAE